MSLFHVHTPIQTSLSHPKQHRRSKGSLDRGERKAQYSALRVIIPVDSPPALQILSS